MCAIVGGTVAAEVIKLVEIAAGKGQVAPINNVLLFDNGQRRLGLDTDVLCRYDFRSAWTSRR